MADELTELRGELITAIINAYHTTRIGSYVPHILGKPTVQAAFDRLTKADAARIADIDWLSGQTSLELTHQGAFHCEDEEGGWCVHRVNGGSNDREWTLIARGATVFEAVAAARTALEPHT